MLLLFLSFLILYIHTNSRVSHNLVNKLDSIAHKIIHTDDKRLYFFANSFGVSVKFVDTQTKQRFFERNGEYFVQKSYPFNNRFMQVTMDISSTKELEKDILNAILAIVFLTTIAILFYISFLTKTFLEPIFILSHKLSDMNENFMKAIDIESLPFEFRALGKSINGLVKRIQNYIKYQKELFTGVSHELKTPLAVLKTKNQVVLIKDRDIAKYKQTLKENNEIVDEVNKMVSTVLEFGRQESAQFEPSETVDIFLFLRKKVQDFKMITKEKEIIDHIPQGSYELEIQPTLLNQIFQNFMQNAIKFAAEKIFVEVKLLNHKIIVTIEDDGEGLPEGLDIFAPFKRDAKSQGIGLGLYLAKSAAHAI
ncbi:MAG: sensor histidine kinase, partial [Campylobacterota bacterium]